MISDLLQKQFAEANARELRQYLLRVEANIKQDPEIDVDSGPIADKSVTIE